MAVKESLMGILTLGPAYGLQLHSELCARAPHRARTNVGQIYGTLDRLVSAGFVVKSGATVDGLPLYALTEKGSVGAQSWLTGETLTSFTEWPEMLDHIMIARSLSDSTLERVIGAYEGILTIDHSVFRQSAIGGEAMVDLAQQHVFNAALAWLGDIRRDLNRRRLSGSSTTASSVTETEESVSRGYRTERPKRGRPVLS
jgi:DNA-binding PadR family transcriptional regulator